MRKVHADHRRLIPVVDRMSPTGARLVEEDTYVILAFALSIQDAKAEGIIAKGFINADGNFEHQPVAALSRFEVFNNPALSEPIWYYKEFLEFAGGDPIRVTPLDFLNFVVDVKGWLPAESQKENT